MAVISPCINICEIDKISNLCRGCHRSLREIASWRELSDTERQKIMSMLPNRKTLIGNPKAQDVIREQ
ncbi:DUF1289 domain-containing protein [Microvirga sp. W0021]|uniref:DUF1289 domain-containing protein n=1 Tax=Hohaiivirga grylli TaxID=3133970 RepID=A0ABV0BHL2_9HYPH